jgi:long-chain acyl-CoA synthetase
MLINEFLAISAERHPDKVALVFRDKRLTFTQINEAASRFSGSLIEKGFRRHDRAIIYLDNSIELVISLFGVLKAGGVFVILNPAVKPPKLAYILADSQARVLITDKIHLEQAARVLLNESSLACVIVSDLLDEDKSQLPGHNNMVFSYREMIEDFTPTPSIVPGIDIDLAGLIYTSGSSGNPKGVMLTHQNMVSAADSIIKYLGNIAEDIIIDTLPLSFDYGLYQVLMAFKFGGTVVLEKGFVFPQQVIDLIVREKVTGWPLTPTIVAILLRLKNLEKNDFSNIRYVTSTGQVLPPNHIARLRGVFPKVNIFSMYGLTECKRVSYLPPDKLDEKPNSVGIAIPNTEVLVVNNEGQEIRDAWKPGELVVRGSTVMRGYWNQPELTAEVLRSGIYPGEKVLYTGDIFQKDEEGYLYFLGRKDDVIKTSGQMVSPKEVENVLCEMADVVEAVVIGIEDEIKGKVIKAFIHLDDNAKITEEDVVRFCRENLEDFAIPKYIIFCKSLPKTDSGKIDKKALG